MTAAEDRYAPTVRWLADEVARTEGGAAAAQVRRAYRYAASHHDGEVRRNGDPYLAHCVAVAVIVAEHGGRGALIAAALLHDVALSPDAAVRRAFDDEVVRLVFHADQVDGDPELPADVGEDAVLLRLAHRLHNLHTIRAMDRDRQVRKATRTHATLVPLAQNMGRPELARLLAAGADRALLSEAGAVAPSPSPGTALLRAAVLVLPARHRERWLGEWRGEMSMLPSRWARWRFAVDVALGCPRMAFETRRASTGEST